MAETYEQWRERMKRDDVPEPPVLFAGHWARKAIEELEAERDRLRALVTDSEAFWDAVYPHITETGPDLNFADCEAITGWLKASLTAAKA